MATAKIVTWPRPNKDGHFPIGIKIWQNGKPSYIFEGHTLESRDLWDAKKQAVKKSVPNSARLTNYLRKKLSEVSNKALEMETNGTAVSAQIIKKEVKPKEEAKPTYFKEIASQYLANHLESGDFDEYTSDKGRLVRFYLFTNNRDIEFPEITVDFLRRYKLFLESSFNFRCKKKKKPLSKTTINNHLSIIRTIYNRAITAKCATEAQYPFEKNGGIKIKPVETLKIGLSEHEIRQLEELVLPENYSYLNDSRNIWLMSFYFAGMRVTDTLLLKWSDFQNGRLYYTMSKNTKSGSLKTPEKVLFLLRQYNSYNATHDLVFPHLKCLDDLDDRLALRKRISTVTRMLGEHMEKLMAMLDINKNASPHKARHSFGQRAKDKKIHLKVLQEMYRHSSIITTMNYQSNFTGEDFDEGLDAVVNF